jgi:putative colanic acid biosynthesis UDP-glucose lipid carrier transferase
MNVLKPYGSVLSALQRVLDACLITAGLCGASWALDHEWTPLLTGASVAAAGLFLLIGEVSRLYGSWRLRSMDDEFKSVLAIWAATCAVLIVAAFLFKISTSYSRLASVAWFLGTPFLLLSSRVAIRVLLRWLRRSGSNIRTVAVAGSSSLAEAIVRELEQSASFGVRVSGIFDDRSPERLKKDGGEPSRRVGTLADLIDDARRGALDYVFIALPMRAEKRIVELTNRLADTTASVYVIPDLFMFDLMRARWTMLGALPMVSVYESPFDGLNGWLKRAEDLFLGGLLLAMAAIPMVLIAFALKLSSTGSVFFRQRRYGLNGRVVRILKFRTMTVSEDGADVSQALHQDPRITSIGRFLRSTSLDELPQLFNVLTGEMSLVGPRPHAVVVNEEYRRLVHGYMLRHKVKPGITGWAQVNGWHGHDTVEKMQKRVDHDLEYVENWSLWLDLKILLLTLLAVISRKNAYIR